MKKILTPLLFISLALSANNEDLSWVDKQVDAIKPPRDGESIRNISKIRNPFIFLKKNSTKDGKKSKSASNNKAVKANAEKKSDSNAASDKTVVFTKHSFVLGAIINQTALINGKWYKLGETVNGYKISQIDKKTVNLKNGSKTKVLSTAVENPKLKFKR